MHVPKMVKNGFNSGFSTAKGLGNHKEVMDMFKDHVDSQPKKEE
jgi:cobalamin biosynthesis Co2+ chelatase CbiK